MATYHEPCSIPGCDHEEPDADAAHLAVFEATRGMRDRATAVAMSPIGAPPEAQTLAEVRAEDGRDLHHGDNGSLPCGACVSCICNAAPSVDEDGLCSMCGGQPVAIAAQTVGLGGPHASVDLDDEQRAEAERLIAEYKPQPRAVADLSDDEIVDAVAAFGPEGFDIEDTFEGSEADTLMQRLGLEQDWDEDDHEDRVEEPLFSRLHAMPERVTVNWYGDRMRLTWAEWGRRIVAAIKERGAILDADSVEVIARLLAGERGDAPDTGRPPRAEDADQPDGFPNPGAGFCRGLGEG